MDTYFYLIHVPTIYYVDRYAYTCTASLGQYLQNKYLSILDKIELCVLYRGTVWKVSSINERYSIHLNYVYELYYSTNFIF